MWSVYLTGTNKNYVRRFSGFHGDVTTFKVHSSMKFHQDLIVLEIKPANRWICIHIMLFKQRTHKNNEFWLLGMNMYGSCPKTQLQR
jgi:hypothetical protein